MKNIKSNKSEFTSSELLDNATIAFINYLSKKYNIVGKLMTSENLEAFTEANDLDFIWNDCQFVLWLLDHYQSQGYMRWQDSDRGICYHYGRLQLEDNECQSISAETMRLLEDSSSFFSNNKEETIDLTEFELTQDPQDYITLAEKDVETLEDQNDIIRLVASLYERLDKLDALN
jgi:hypothetical protein